MNGEPDLAVVEAYRTWLPPGPAELEARAIVPFLLPGAEVGIEYSGGYRLFWFRWRDDEGDEIAETPLFYSDSGALYRWNDERRPCAACARPLDHDAPDPCLGLLPGVVFACCGHGVTEYAYVSFRDGGSAVRRGVAALDVFEQQFGAGPGMGVEAT